MECHWEYVRPTPLASSEAFLMSSNSMSFALQMLPSTISTTIQARCTLFIDQANRSLSLQRNRSITINNCDVIPSHNVYHPLHQGTYLNKQCIDSRAPYQACGNGHLVFPFHDNSTKLVDATFNQLGCCNSKGILPHFECTTNGTTIATCKAARFATYSLYDVHVLQILIDLMTVYPQMIAITCALVVLVVVVATVTWAWQSLQLYIDQDSYLEIHDELL